MQDAKRAIPFFSVGHRITVVAVVAVLLAGSVCAQDLRRLKECENLLSVAATAELQKDSIEAELRYEECRELAQTHRLPKMEAAALHRLAVIRARNRKFSESANLFRSALKLDPKNALILCDFAQLHADRKDYTEAEKLLKEALDADPNNQKILFNLGTIVASQRSERHTEGLRYLKLAVGESEAYRELAKIYRAQGDVSRAEFAEQKAKDAGNKASSGSLAGNNYPTPPEVIGRNRQEIIDSKTREIIGVQQQPSAPVTYIPFIPAPVSPATGQPATSSSEEPVVVPAPAATPLPWSSTPPVDPFAELMRPQPPAMSPVRKLEPPPAVSAFSQTSVRALPNYSETLPGNPPAVQNNIHDPFAPIQTVEPPGIPTQDNRSPTPGFLIISRPGENAVNPSQPPYSPISNAPKMETTSIRVLPTIPGPSGETKSAERKVQENKTANNVGNPLRTIHFGDTGLPDSAANVSILASLPSYSAVGGSEIARIDQNIAKEQPDSVSKKTELRQSPAPNGTITREFKPLPVREVDVLQSPSSVIVRRDVPRSGTQSAPLESGAKQPVAATPESGYAKIIQSDRRFSSANAPEVLEFGFAKNDLKPPEKPVVAVVRPLEQNAPPQVAHSVVRLPQVVSKGVDNDSVSPQTAMANPVYIVPTVVPVPAEPLPLEPAPTFTDVREPVMVAVVPHDPFPLIVNDSPRFAEVRDIKPQIPAPITEPTQEPARVAIVPARPVPVIADAIPSPRFTEVKNIEPRILPLSEPTAVAHLPADPFLMVANDPARFAEVKRIEPQTLGVTQPPIAALPADPFVVASNPVPKFTEVKRPELPQQTPVAALPINRSHEMPSPPVLAETKQPEPLPRVSPVPVEVPQLAAVQTVPILSAPVREEPAGFASTRRTELRMAVSDGQAGFARSRR